MPAADKYPAQSPLTRLPVDYLAELIAKRASGIDQM